MKEIILTDRWTKDTWRKGRQKDRQGTQIQTDEKTGGQREVDRIKDRQNDKDQINVASTHG